VDKFGDDERPYLESQGTDWFTLWAFANVAAFGLGMHTRNVMGPKGSSLNFHIWFPCVALFGFFGRLGMPPIHISAFGLWGLGGHCRKLTPVSVRGVGTIAPSPRPFHFKARCETFLAATR
jgi:hypothetical protein